MTNPWEAWWATLEDSDFWETEEKPVLELDREDPSSFLELWAENWLEGRRYAVSSEILSALVLGMLVIGAGAWYGMVSLRTCGTQRWWDLGILLCGLWGFLGLVFYTLEALARATVFGKEDQLACTWSVSVYALLSMMMTLTAVGRALVYIG